MFVVHDNGVGMKVAEIDSMFDLYAQGADSASRPTGLGIELSLLRSLVEQHGGQVEASSDGPGHGSTFVVRIPRTMLDETPPVAKPPRAAVKPRCAGSTGRCTC